MGKIINKSKKVVKKSSEDKSTVNNLKIPKDCREYRLYMWPYLNLELNDSKIDLLMKHVDSCSECKNELKIQFLVSEGLNRLENNHSGYNLLNDFEARLVESKDRCRRLEYSNLIVSWGSFFLFVFTLLILVGSLFNMI